jgi:hypothetical protein
LSRPAEEHREEVQEVCVVNINPGKLMDKLRTKFPSGFEVSVRTTSLAVRLLFANPCRWCTMFIAFEQQGIFHRILHR